MSTRPIVAVGRALAVQRRGLRDWIAIMGASSPGATLFERDGVSAAIVPASPRRSIANSVSYTSVAALRTIIDELGARYDRAGVEAWTVWAPELDREAAGALEAAGHRFDGSPVAMSTELCRVELPPLGDLDWDAEAAPAELGAVNDLAYGLEPPDGYAPSLAAPPTGGALRLYRARVRGVVACALGTIDHGSDLGFYFVATDPEHRGRGLATRLMAAAIEQARVRGLATSSLQASAQGRPVYERLGFDVDFDFALYERRR